MGRQLIGNSVYLWIHMKQKVSFKQLGVNDGYFFLQLLSNSFEHWNILGNLKNTEVHSYLKRFFKFAYHIV